MDADTFHGLPTPEVAALVRAGGVRAVAFPINGTRRWFMLEHPAERDPAAYLDITWRRHIEIYKLLFDHGIDTLVTPIFGPDLLERGEAYRQLIEPGMLWLATHESMLEFYEEYDVRVRIYGEAERYFGGTPYAPVLEAYAEVTRRTAGHRRRRLFFGVCAHDAAEAIARIGARHFREHGHAPDRAAIVAAYYGEPVDPISIFIGFDRPAVFDVPLLATGREDLYFTVSPSLYLDRQSLRAILYDHLFERRASEAYEQLTADDWRALSEFYAANRHSVLGVGRRDASGCVWLPLPQVRLSGIRNE